MPKQSWVQRRLGQRKPAFLPGYAKAERLTDCAIMRDDQVHFGGKSHAQVRAKLGDKTIYDHKPGDIEGFMTSTRRFVDRESARLVAINAGQIPPSFNRELLSSDVNW